PRRQRLHRRRGVRDRRRRTDEHDALSLRALPDPGAGLRAPVPGGLLADDAARRPRRPRGAHRRRGGRLRARRPALRAGLRAAHRSGPPARLLIDLPCKIRPDERSPVEAARSARSSARSSPTRSALRFSPPTEPSCWRCSSDRERSLSVPRFYIVHNGEAAAAPRVAALESAARARGIEPCPVDSSIARHTHDLPPPRPGDLLYNCARGSTFTESLLLSTELATMYRV